MTAVDVSSMPLKRAGVRGSRGSGVPDALSGPVYSSVSLLRAAEIMAFGAVSTAELSRALCCNVRTGRRVLERLVEEGWARCASDSPRRYSLSLRGAAMGAQALSRSPFATMAASLVGDLAAQADRTAFVAVPCYERLLCVAGSEGAPFRRGDLLDIAGSAAGLALLAHRPGWRRELPPAVDERELAQVVSLGHARVDQEIAVPMRWGEEGVLGAVTLVAVEPHEVALVKLARELVAQSSGAAATRTVA